MECSPPCQGGGRGFKSRQDRTRPGSSVGTSVRLKIGRSAVRPRPWPPAKIDSLLSPVLAHGGTMGARVVRRRTDRCVPHHPWCGAVRVSSSLEIVVVDNAPTSALLLGPAELATQLRGLADRGWRGWQRHHADASLRFIQSPPQALTPGAVNGIGPVASGLPAELTVVAPRRVRAQGRT
jgi:hypothetical protein